MYLAAHFILEEESPENAADKAEIYLRRFLDVLSVVTSNDYRIKERVLVVDWTTGLTTRRFLRFNTFPNPNVPVHALSGAHFESVKKLMANPIPRSVQLAMDWWARGVSASEASEQFQFFWYALEILGEHTKPSVRVPSTCPKCRESLFCPNCKEVPLHRPYPKQAVKMLVDKHVKGEPDHFFALIDQARNKLMHGDDRKKIERDLNIKWEAISDSLGKATWAALISILIKTANTNATEPERLKLIISSTYLHYHVMTTSDISMRVSHADPSSPQIEEFQPSFEVDMIVEESQGETKTEPEQSTVEDKGS